MELRFSENRRKHPRAERMCLSVRLQGESFEVTNWSMGGFLLENYQGHLSTGALIRVVGLGCRDGKVLDVDLPARVVRTDENTVAVSYLGLDTNAYHFLTDALNQCGEMRSLVKDSALL